MTKIKVTLVQDEEFASMEFRPPAKYFVRSATGYLFIHCRDRAAATQYVKEEFGGKYTVRCSTSENSRVEVGEEFKHVSKEYSAVGRINTKSRMNSKGPRS